MLGTSDADAVLAAADTTGRSGSSMSFGAAGTARGRFLGPPESIPCPGECRVRLVTSKRQQLQRIAERYRSEGYEVWLDPAPELMPARLGWLRGDLIAQRGDEHVLVLVDGEDNQLQFLADIVGDIVGDIAGWRLDVHVAEN